MSSLASQRCFHHATREAAARCPECGRFFCRECITEHEQRVLCAACLKKILHPRLTQRSGFVLLTRSVQFLLGLFIIWSFFYIFGDALLSIDASFHEGSVWKEKWLDSE